MMMSGAVASWLMTMKITDDMIIPINYRGVNHGRTDIEVCQTWAGGHYRQAHLDSGLVEFGRFSRMGDVGARVGTGCHTSNIHDFFVCSCQVKGVSQ